MRVPVSIEYNNLAGSKVIITNEPTTDPAEDPLDHLLGWQVSSLHASDCSFDLVAEIKILHSQIISFGKLSLKNAIRIGDLLTQQKIRLGHGLFMAWIKANLPFTDRTARNYMALWENREKFKTETVSDLTTAYASLAKRADPKQLPARDFTRTCWFCGQLVATAPELGVDWYQCTQCGATYCKQPPHSPFGLSSRSSLCGFTLEQLDKKVFKVPRNKTQAAEALENRASVAAGWAKHMLELQAECLSKAKLMRDAIDQKSRKTARGVLASAEALTPKVVGELLPGQGPAT